MKPIPYGRQDISSDDIQAVIDVLKSDFLTQGPAIERFEKTVATYCGAKFSVAVSNATAALHLACLAVGLKPGDLLWTSPITFVASANCGLYCGADVDFVDIDPITYNMSVSALKTKLEQAKRQGRLPKVVIPVHLAGQSCEMKQIRELSIQYGFRVIEDASHAIGGSYRDRKVGSCEFSDATVFSFHPVKIVTSGEGGMVLTNDQELSEKISVLRTHGITRDPKRMTQVSDGPWYYQQIELGFNYRITDLQAALGDRQMTRIDEFVTRRNELVARYNNAFKDMPVVLPKQNPETYSAFHLYLIRLRREQIQKSHKSIFEEMIAAGILVNLHYIPVHLQPYYSRLGFKSGQFPEAEKYYQEAISLPLYYGLSNQDQDRVIQTLAKVLAK